MYVCQESRIMINLGEKQQSSSIGEILTFPEGKESQCAGVHRGEVGWRGRQMLDHLTSHGACSGFGFYSENTKKALEVYINSLFLL